MKIKFFERFLNNNSEEKQIIDEEKLFHEFQSFLFQHNLKYSLTKSFTKNHPEYEYSIYVNEKGCNLYLRTDSILKVEEFLHNNLFYDEYFSYNDNYNCVLQFIKFEFPCLSVIEDKDSIDLYEENVLIEHFTFRKELVDYFTKYYEYSYEKLYDYICKNCHNPFGIIKDEDNVIIYECETCENKKIEVL